MTTMRTMSTTSQRVSMKGIVNIMGVAIFMVIGALGSVMRGICSREGLIIND